MITAITCTGDRPQAFSLVQKWMIGQTVRPDEWIVVDDGKNPMPFDWVTRRDPQPDDPQHTMLLNLKTALPLVRGEYVFFIEDDEYYAPTYIEQMLERLKNFELVGIGRSKYYHVPTRGYKQHQNMDHASLAQTACRKSFLTTINSLLDGDSFLDIRIWKAGSGLIFHDDKGSLYCGMKGMPGREGIGYGHKRKPYAYIDQDLSVLRSWVADYQDYLPYIGGK